MDSKTFERWVQPWIFALGFWIPPAYPGPWYLWRDWHGNEPADREQAVRPGGERAR